MKTCGWMEKVEVYFDGEHGDAPGVEAHVAQCHECAAYLKQLQVLRQGVAPLREVRGIEDAQFGAFMAGIREEIETPVRASFGGLWAMVSLVAAALIVALAVFSMFTGPQPVKATEVKSISTDLPGATIDVKSADDGPTIVITPSQRYQEDIQ
ncbi:MAG: hypothetical protein HYV26_24240 [Candidatus Hydrogenedentes bacterium]|nr:hypothetical protein [Candidatus Hydrogenedentota bacterium]MBI3118346.1 hypothetical protein [Candidatus Hydrogenedentota bacterium]